MKHIYSNIQIRHLFLSPYYFITTKFFIRIFFLKYWYVVYIFYFRGIVIINEIYLRLLLKLMKGKVCQHKYIVWNIKWSLANKSSYLSSAQVYILIGFHHTICILYILYCLCIYLWHFRKPSFYHNSIIICNK